MSRGENGSRGRIASVVLADDVDYPKMAIYAVGAFMAVAVLSFLNLDLQQPLLIASFGATTIILFAMPGSRAARPRNAFFGQVISASVAVLLYHLLGCTWISLAIGVSLALVVMVVTDTLHPPGGATVIACLTSQSPTWTFVLMPVAVGVLFLVMVAALTGLAYRGYVSRRPAVDH